MSIPEVSPASDTASETNKLAKYIESYFEHCQRWFAPAMRDIEGKRVMVLGSGWGTEALWAAVCGAREVVGLDPAPRTREPLELALKRRNAAHLSERIKLMQNTTFDAPDIGEFDYIISNNVIEHITGLAGTFHSLRRFMPKHGRGRAVVFTDPLFYSSAGAHLPLRKWEHLTIGSAKLKTKVSPTKWLAYQNTLNGMTITDMLGAVRESGMILLDLRIVRDRNLSSFNKVAPMIPSGIKPMDLCLEGLFMELTFPENL